MVCVHTYSESDNALLRYGRSKFSKMAAGRHLEFDPTGNGAVGSAVPENPTLEPNTKSIGWCVAEIWSFEVFQDGRRPPSWIWSNRKWRRWIRRPRKPHPRTKHEGDRLTCCRVMAIWNFPKMCELALRSVVGRSSVVNIHTSYTDLITPLSLR